MVKVEPYDISIGEGISFSYIYANFIGDIIMEDIYIYIVTPVIKGMSSVRHKEFILKQKKCLCYFGILYRILNIESLEYLIFVIVLGIRVNRLSRNVCFLNIHSCFSYIIKYNTLPVV